MGMNSHQFTGRLTRAVEDIGGNGVKFTLAVDSYDFGAKQKKTLFVPCVAFGRVVTTLKQYTDKGREIGITARYDQREYTPSQGPRAGTLVHEHTFVVDTVELIGSPPAGQQPFQASAPDDDSPSGW